MATQDLNIAIVGCGNIAGPYAHTLKPYSHIHLLGATDVDPQRAQAFVAEMAAQPTPRSMTCWPIRASTRW